MPKALDLKNQIFGNLKAIEKAPSKNGKTCWKCECLLCGKEKLIQTCHLTDGSIKSCGNHGVTKYQDIEQKCAICGNLYFSNSSKRRYCYECSPKGLNPTDRLRHNKRVLKHYLLKYKGNKCEKCGYSKCEGALHFHHKDPSTKNFSISNINLNNLNYSIEEILREVDKCLVLCANCHAEIHYK